MRFSLRRLQTFPFISLGFFALAVFSLFTPLLFNTQGHVWSKPGLDMTTENIPWWTFGFGEWAKGNFPLWNPHSFCGTPYFSNFNAGMLYPVNWVNRLLPLPVAVNLILIVDFVLAGWFTSLWVHRRGVSRLASILGGTIYMLSGAYFLHMYPGHVSPLAAMDWAPVILMAIDGLFTNPGLKWALVGMLAVGMQIFSGFPQAVYDTALIGGIYTLLRLVRHADGVRIGSWCLSIYVGGMMLGAVQLLSGMQTASESVREGGNSFQFAGVGSFSPVNFLTLLAPGVLGDMEHVPYVGHSFLWETCLFFGASTLILAAYGGWRGDRRLRIFSVTMLLVSIVLALGIYLKPVFFVLFKCVPLFSSFRVAARFNWFTTLFVAMLAAIGFDVIVETRPWRRGPLVAAFSLACVVAVLASICVSTSHSEFGLWGEFLTWAHSGADYFHPEAIPLTAEQISATGRFAAGQLAVSMLALLLMAGALGALKISIHFRYLLAAITLGELLCFACSLNVEGPMYMDYPRQWLATIRADPPQSRVLNPSLKFGNVGMAANFDDLYGYDPVSLKRYTELIAMTQGNIPVDLNFMPHIDDLRYPAVFAMLRCRHIFYWSAESGSADPVPRRIEVSNALNELELVRQFQVKNGRDEVFAAMRTPGFDGGRMVILESPPVPAPAPPDTSSPGRAWVEKASTDWLEIRAELEAPAILLITDAYSKSWRARPLSPGPQASYTVMPANWALRAIPLAAGKHHLLLEYRPIGYTIGKWITILAVLAWLAALALVNGGRLANLVAARRSNRLYETS